MTTKEYYSSIYNGNISKNKVLKEPYYTNLLNITNFLDITATNMERIYCLLNDITSVPVCERTGCCNKVKFPHHLIKADRHYRRFCSTECSNNDSNVQIEKSKTCMRNYGVDNPSKSKTVHDLKIKTITKNYGGFGMASSTLSKIIRETNILKYGKTNPSECLKIKNKIKYTHLNRSVSQKNISSEKRKATMFIKYGLDHNPINGYSKIATKFIDNYIIKNNLDKNLCLYGENEFYIRFENKIYFYDLVKFKTVDGLKSKNCEDIELILEYDGKFWHPTIDQSITYREVPMIKQGMSYREKYLYDLKKIKISKKLMDKNNGKLIIYKENQTARILP